jgi:hypothetical protein
VLTPLQGTALEGVSTNWMGASACRTDKVQRFEAGGLFIHKKAATCTNDAEYRGTWTLSNKNKKINVQYAGGGPGNFTYTIIALSPRTLTVQQLERTLTSAGPLDLLMQFEFEAQ